MVLHAGADAEGGTMKLIINRYTLQIVPESDLDSAYLETVMGLKHEGDSVPLTRRNAIGMSCWGYAEVKAP